MREMNIVIPLGTGRKSLSVSTKLLDLLSYPLVTSKHHLYLPWTGDLSRAWLGWQSIC